MLNLHEHALVSVILPCFNEHKNILPLIREIHEILTLWHWKHEIVVVDVPPEMCMTRSPHGELNEAEHAARRLSELREIALLLAADVVDHPRNVVPALACLPGEPAPSA